MPLNPEFIDVPARQLLALSRDYTLATRSEIPELWNTFWSAGWPYSSNDGACYGACYTAKPDGSFSYAVGIPVSPLPSPLPDGACIVTLSAGRHAVFRNQGPVSELPAFFDAIFSEWLPASGESQRDGAVFERYPLDDNAALDNMRYEIWVPLSA